MLHSREIAQAVYELAQEGGNKNVVTELVVYLEKNNLLPLLGQIVQHIERIHVDSQNKLSLDIVSAYKLPKSVIKDIQESLGATEIGNVTEDSNLIGGFVAEHNGVVYDASVVTQINKLKSALMS